MEPLPRLIVFHWLGDWVGRLSVYQQELEQGLHLLFTETPAILSSKNKQHIFLSY